MTLGCPAIVAPCGALPEVCGAAAAYADPHDPSAWVAAVERLAGGDAERTARAAASRAHAQTFTWDAAARRLIDLLETA